MTTTYAQINLMSDCGVREVAYFPCSVVFERDGYVERLTLTGVPFQIARGWWAYKKQFPDATMTLLNCEVMENTSVRFERKLKRFAAKERCVYPAGRYFEGLKVTPCTLSTTTTAHLSII